MSRALFVIKSEKDRQSVQRLAATVPRLTRIEFKATKRSIPQNDKMWAMLTDVSRQISWHGIKLQAESWKFIFLDALSRELKMVPNLDGTGFVNIGRSSSDLSKGEISDVIELIYKFGAEHGVVFGGEE
jgi:hypothetical protein